MKLARVLRIIEYVGEPEWVKACIATRQLKGRGDFPGHGYITEAILGDTSEILEYSALQAAAEDLVNRKICPVCEGGKKADSTACRTCGGLAYVSQIGDFDETAEELRRECAKAVGKVETDERLGAEEHSGICTCGHDQSQHRVRHWSSREYQCGGVDPYWSCDVSCPKFVAS